MEVLHYPQERSISYTKYCYNVPAPLCQLEIPFALNRSTWQWMGHKSGDGAREWVSREYIQFTLTRAHGAKPEHVLFAPHEYPQVLNRMKPQLARALKDHIQYDDSLAGVLLAEQF
jgi:hypothetical protein